MNKEKVQITIKVPKELVDLLEAENYLGYSKEQFFEMAIRSHISGVTGNYHYRKMLKFREKYGKDISRFYLPESLED